MSTETDIAELQLLVAQLRRDLHAASMRSEVAAVVASHALGLAGGVAPEQLAKLRMVTRLAVQRARRDPARSAVLIEQVLLTLDGATETVKALDETGPMGPRA